MLFQDPVVRPVIFLGLVILFSALEAVMPRRQRLVSRSRRWLGNYGVLVLGTILARIVLPMAPVGAAVWALENTVGLFNVVPLPWVLGLVLAFLTLDLLIYTQHRVFHAIPLLWRFHRMHHTDMDFDVSTGIRFHPIEILLSLIIKIGAVIALGAHPLAVVVFEIVLNGTSLFNHANLTLPARLDRVLRCVVVTPDMHRVHHSVRPEETNSNFSFSLPLWDHLFGTYRAQPADGHTAMTVGLDTFRDQRAIDLSQLLIQPFTDDRDTPANTPAKP